MEINNNGEIECVTENIKDIISHDRTELYKKPIYSLLPPSDHSKIRPVIRSVQNFGWSTTESEKFHAIKTSLLKNFNKEGVTGLVFLLFTCLFELQCKLDTIKQSKVRNLKRSIAN